MTQVTTTREAPHSIDTSSPSGGVPVGWRLHSGVRLRPVDPACDRVHITCGGQRWMMRNVERTTLTWLRGLHQQPRTLVRPSGGQAQALAQWLVDRGLLIACRPDRVLISGDTSASIAGRWQGRLHLAAPPLVGLPTRAEMDSHAGVLVITGQQPDRALAWLARECGVPTIVVHTEGGRCRVGNFLGHGACLTCEDLVSISTRPLLAHRLVMGTAPTWRNEASLPAWMLDWAAAQVVVQLRRWQADPSITPAWDWIDHQGRTGREVVEPHPLCCGRAQAASGAA